MNKDNAVNPEEDWCYVFYKKAEGIGGRHLKQMKPNSEEWILHGSSEAESRFFLKMDIKVEKRDENKRESNAT